MVATLAYAASLLPEIADMPSQVDAAMTEGYGWSSGPFQLIDKLGPAQVEQYLSQSGALVPPSLRQARAQGRYFLTEGTAASEIAASGARVPSPRAEGILDIAGLNAARKLVRDFGHLRLWDMGGGVAGLELATKLGTMSASTLGALDQARILAEGSFGAIVIGSDHSYFSAGADLGFLYELIIQGDLGAIEEFIECGQRTLAGFKYSAIPIVAAVSGFALGGGCELALHCTAIQAHAECKMGLVEARVGLVPAWGGCKEMLSRFVVFGQHSDIERPPNWLAFELIARSATSSSAFDARQLGYLRPSDGLTMNRARLLKDAHSRAIREMEGYERPKVIEIALPTLPSVSKDPTDVHAKLRLIFASSGEALSEHILLQREKSAFLELVTSASTIEKVRAVVR